MTKPRYIDLTGQQFGMLTVIGFDSRRPNGKQKVIWWECVCECGKVKAFRGSHLKRGATTNCGCNHGKPGVSRAWNDLQGQRFGRLTAVELLGKNGSTTSTYWLCKCDCGTEKAISRTALLSNETISCGCYHKERWQNYIKNRIEDRDPIYFMTSEKFQSYRSGARYRNLEFKLTFEDISNLIFKPCFYCGKIYQCNIDNVVLPVNGIDRIDNNYGYVLTNVVPACWKCNYAKGSKTQKEFIDWVLSTAKFLGDNREIPRD